MVLENPCSEGDLSMELWYFLYTKPNYATVVTGLIILLSLAASSVAFAQDDPVYLREVHAIDTNDLGLLNPAGLAFSPDANIFFVLEAHSTAWANIATMTPFDELVDTVGVDVSMIDPINLAFDNWANRLLLFDTASSELVEIDTDPDGHLDPSPEARRYQVGQLGVQEPRGMTVDPASGHLFILDSAALQIVRIEPDAQDGFDGAAALKEGRVSRVDLTQAGLVDPQGLAFNPINGHLYLLSPADQRLYELIETGRVVAIFQLPPFEFVDPHGLVFAFSGDATDDPSIINLYIADTGLSEGKKTGQELGRIMEMSLPVIYVPGDGPVDDDNDLSGDDNLIALNQIFVGSTNLALKNVDGDSKRPMICFAEME